MLAIGSSDTHVSSGSPNNLGMPQTVIYANSLSQQGIINGLRQAKAYITSLSYLKFNLTAEYDKKTAGIGEELLVDKSTQVKIRLTFTPLPNATLNLIGSQGLIQSLEIKNAVQSFMINANNTNYLRIEVRDPNGQMLIISNPIWIKLKS